MVTKGNIHSLSQGDGSEWTHEHGFVRERVGHSPPPGTQWPQSAVQTVSLNPEQLGETKLPLSELQLVPMIDMGNEKLYTARRLRCARRTQGLREGAGRVPQPRGASGAGTPPGSARGRAGPARRRVTDPNSPLQSESSGEVQLRHLSD